MKMAQYFAAQEQRWYEKYIDAERVINQLEEMVARRVGRIVLLEEALQEISKVNNKRDRYSDEIDGLIIAALGETDV
jgi:acyl carrier protein phosphodiesterase